MNSDSKTLGGIFSGVPPYQVLNNQQELQSAQNNDLTKLIQQQEHKFWSVKSLFAFSTLQMVFGMFLICGQFILNMENCTSNTKQPGIYESYNLHTVETIMVETFQNNVLCETLNKPATTFAYWCGGLIFITGLLNGLATKFKTNFLLVVSSFLCVVGYGVSLCSLIMSAILTQFDLNATHKAILVGISVISGFNFFLFILTSALFCRASCSCCQPRTPTIMYLSSVDDSTSQQQQNEAFNSPA